MSGKQKPMRLPPLKVLRVKNPNREGERPCMAIMSSVLACWASAGYNTAGCVQMEQALRACMDGPQPSAARKSEINYHLSRFQSRVAGVKKP
ncbi:putative 37S ribosomal protein Mrp10 [Seiridium cardinale]|uniref:Small ribosomal subunit protein mS37 n=1 Tax=Seiridium cardinale TaxID=138064 RepID=A0ABR2XF13_9PEZI